MKINILSPIKPLYHAFPKEGDRIFYVKNGEILARVKSNKLIFPLIGKDVSFEHRFIPVCEGSEWNLFILEDDLEKVNNFEFIPFRQLLSMGESYLTAQISYAFQINQWNKEFRYCGKCGSLMIRSSKERAKNCPNCGHISFPRISPAMICAITKGDSLLLARGKRFQRPMFSLIAGFVEPGESLEQTVEREIQEEVGLKVKNIRYIGSQSWAPSSSLMAGFTAEYESGEICLQEEEILDARWFDRDDLPDLPDFYSIARKIINLWIKREFPFIKK